MEKIKNPWIGIEGYNCFGCSPKNTNGLKMEFYEDGDFIISKWKPQSQFQGWLNTLHGGIQCTLIDETAAWAIAKKLKTCGMTTKIETKFIKSIDITKGDLTIKAKITNVRHSLVSIDAIIENADGELCNKAKITYYIFSKEDAKEKFFFDSNKIN